jgi:hypothetical protein
VRWIAEARARKWKPWSAIAKFTSVYGITPSQEMVRKATEISRMTLCASCVVCRPRSCNLLPQNPSPAWHRRMPRRILGPWILR